MEIHAVMGRQQHFCLLDSAACESIVRRHGPIVAMRKLMRKLCAFFWRRAGKGTSTATSPSTEPPSADFCPRLMMRSPSDCRRRQPAAATSLFFTPPSLPIMFIISSRNRAEVMIAVP